MLAKLTKAIKYTRIGVLFFLFTSFVLGQEKQDPFFHFVDESNFIEARLLVDEKPNNTLKTEYLNYLDVVELGNFENINLENLEAVSVFSLKHCFKLLNQGLKEYLQLGNSLKAHRKFNESLKIAEKLNNDQFISLNVQYILEMYSRTAVRSNDISYKYLVERLQKLKHIKYNLQKANYYNFKITLRYFYQDSIKISLAYNKTNTYFNKIPTSKFKAQNHTTNSIFQTQIIQNQDSALYYINLAKTFFQNKTGYFENSYQKRINLNLGVIHLQNNKIQKAKFFLDQAFSEKKDAIFTNLNSYVLDWKHRLYLAEGDSINALKYQNKYLTQELLLNQSDNLQQISEYETKYETDKKEQQILVEQQKRKQNQYITIALAAIIILGSFIAFLLNQNTKRKQKLAEQQKVLETQKLNTVLKEQELTAIDAMIEGQEKERQQIANDLHDDLGGLMATVKLHFNALKDKKSPELFDKTNALIDEAYHKVRSVAHAKNSGVIAKHGLLKSIKEMADKISISNKLHIEVVDYGLDTRLENSLELTIFRIAQELVSNAIKHAEASEITIHLTNHDDSINLLVEDNGKGFDTSQITKTTKGMGISSIDKRVEHLDGKMTIESEKNKGTTVIIDIPL